MYTYAAWASLKCCVIENAHVDLTWPTAHVSPAIEARYEDATKVRCVVETPELVIERAKVWEGRGGRAGQ
jgi:hypothetical protein